MDPVWSSIFSAGIAATAALSGSFLTLLLQQRSEHRKWAREETRLAYSNALKALSKATIVPIGVKTEVLQDWFDTLSDVRESLIVLQVYCLKGRGRLQHRSNSLFKVIDENNYVLLATTATTIKELDGDSSGVVLLGVGKIRSEIVAALEEVTDSARQDLKQSLAS